MRSIGFISDSIVNIWIWIIQTSLDMQLFWSKFNCTILLWENISSFILFAIFFYYFYACILAINIHLRNLQSISETWSLCIFFLFKYLKSYQRMLHCLISRISHWVAISKRKYNSAFRWENRILCSFWYHTRKHVSNLWTAGG